MNLISRFLSRIFGSGVSERAAEPESEYIVFATIIYEETINGNIQWKYEPVTKMFSARFNNLTLGFTWDTWPYAVSQVALKISYPDGSKDTVRAEICHLLYVQLRSDENNKQRLHKQELLRQAIAAAKSE